MPKSEKVPDSNGRIDKRVAYFVMIRDQIDALKEEHKKALKPYEEQKQKLIGELLDFLDKGGLKSVKTAEGTATVQVKPYASCSDPDAFIDFVRENDAYELMDRRANATACRDYAEEHGALPPGVKLTSVRTVGVTRA